MKEFTTNNLTKRFELNIVEDPDYLKDAKDDSLLSNSKGSYIPPADTLSSRSLSGINKKLIIRAWLR